jgi:hypothetical protein
VPEFETLGERETTIDLESINVFVTDDVLEPPPCATVIDEMIEFVAILDTDKGGVVEGVREGVMDGVFVCESESVTDDVGERVGETDGVGVSVGVRDCVGDGVVVAESVFIDDIVAYDVICDDSEL